MDTGAFETEMAVKAGADVVGILGAASDGTFREAVKAARKYGAKVYMDLISVQDKVARARQARELGCDYVALHMGVDEQMGGAKPLDMLRLLRQKRLRDQQREISVHMPGLLEPPVQVPLDRLPDRESLGPDHGSAVRQASPVG